jgi:hypothetical protein
MWTRRSRPRTPVRRALTFTALLVVGAVMLGACHSGGSRASTDLTTPTTTPGFFNKLPPATVQPGCPVLYGDVAKLTVDDGGLIPRCAIVTTSQKLQVTNNGKQFHNVQIEDLNANLSPNDTQHFEKLGKYLAPGIYLIWSWTESDAAVFPNFNGTLVLKGS